MTLTVEKQSREISYGNDGCDYNLGSWQVAAAGEDSGIRGEEGKCELWWEGKAERSGLNLVTRGTFFFLGGGGGKGVSVHLQNSQCYPLFSV